MNRVHINILFFLSLIMLALMTFFVTSAQAASGHSATTAVSAATAGPAATSGGLFTGTFKGVLLGDDDSRAPVTLELMQDGRVVTGEIVVGRGLLRSGVVNVVGGHKAQVVARLGIGNAAGDETWVSGSKTRWCW